MKREWFKIQPPLHGNGGAEEVLIYNKSKLVEYIIPKLRLSDEIKESLKNSPIGKIFAEGQFIQNNGYEGIFEFKGKVVDSTNPLYLELSTKFFNSPKSVRKNFKKMIATRIKVNSFSW